MSYLELCLRDEIVGQKNVLFESLYCFRDMEGMPGLEWTEVVTVAQEMVVAMATTVVSMEMITTEMVVMGDLAWVLVEVVVAVAVVVVSEGIFKGEEWGISPLSQLHLERYLLV